MRERAGREGSERRVSEEGEMREEGGKEIVRVVERGKRRRKEEWKVREGGGKNKVKEKHGRGRKV